MNIIKALEEYKHERTQGNSESQVNHSEGEWERKPAIRRKERKRLEEMIPDKKSVIDFLIRKQQVFYENS